MATTAEELARFGTAPFGGRILSTESLAEMLDTSATQGLAGLERVEAYGLGVGAVEYEGLSLWIGAGEMPGIEALVAHSPDRGVTIAILLNVEAPPQLDAIFAAVAEGSLSSATVP